MCVDRLGKTVYSEIIYSSFITIDEKKVVDELLKGTLGYKFGHDLSVPCLECGKLMVKFNECKVK